MTPSGCARRSATSTAPPPSAQVREVVQEPIRDLSCPLEPRINWDLLAVEVRCTVVLGSGDELAVPVRYTPGAGFSAGQPRQVG